MRQAGIGAILLALAVGMGAFGAHGLRSHLSEYSMGVYEKAVLYHFIHAFGMLIVPVMIHTGLLKAKAGGRIWFLLLLGVALFSGSLYVLAIAGVPWLGAITPLGGLAFIGAWLFLGWELLRSRPQLGNTIKA